MTRSVVVMSALEAEMTDLVEAMVEPTPIAIGHARAFTGEIDGHRATVMRAGIGKVATALAVGLAWERLRPELFIFSGVAGGLSRDLHIGDIVIGEMVAQHDTGVLGPAGLERYQAGHIPFFNPTSDFGFRPSADVLGKTRQVVDGLTLLPVLGRVPRVMFGTILTGDQYLHSARDRDGLARSLGALAVEMEGAAMAQAATLIGADHLVIRALSDLAGEESIEDFGRYAGEVARNTASLVRRLLAVL